MKKKFFIGAITLASVAILATGAAIASQRLFKSTNAVGPYSFENTGYEVAFMEQFNDGTAYGYSIDKPLEGNSLGGHMYGSYDDGVQANKEYDLKIGVNTDLKWKFSAIRAKSDTSSKLTYARLECNSSDKTITNTEKYPEATYPDEYALGQIMTGKSMTRVGAMISKVAIENIQDISIYWRTTYTERIYIMYQISGETEWKQLHSMTDSDIDDGVPIAGNYTGTRGWDAHGYTTFNSSSWHDKDLYGATAKIAILTAGKSVSGNIPISAIVINQERAAVRYLNALTYRDNICTDGNLIDLHKSTSDYSHNQALFQLATERVSGSALAEYDLAGTKTSDLNALSFYNHLVTAIPGLGQTK